MLTIRPTIIPTLALKLTNTFTTRYFLAVIIGLSSIFFLHQASAQCSVPCTLLWADEFNGTEVDESIWEFQLGTGSDQGLTGWGNGELQFYRKQNASVANGFLTITARKDYIGGYAYSSSRMRTKNNAEWTYGRIEMRAKLPSGQGLWPAFWMLPTNSPYGGWAASGEIDIMESRGSDPDNILGTIHYGDYWPNNQYSGGSYRTATSASDNFYTYAVEWAPTEFRWYIKDDAGTEIHYHTVNTWNSINGPFPAPFDKKFHLLLNLAVGGHFDGNPQPGTIFPNEYIIDYVRVYQTADTIMPPPPPDYTSLLIDDMDHGSPSSNAWFAFGSDIGGGNINGYTGDVAPDYGGSHSLKVDFGSNGQTGFIGGFGKSLSYDVTGMEWFEFWINPAANQHYSLEMNIQDDDNSSGSIETNHDEEYQYVCEISNVGPCAIAGGGWQLIKIPIDDFTRDTSYMSGGNLSLDTAEDGNGKAEAFVIAIINQGASNVNFVTDQWQFARQGDEEVYEVPFSFWSLGAFALSLISITLIQLKRRS